MVKGIKKSIFDFVRKISISKLLLFIPILILIMGGAVVEGRLIIPVVYIYTFGVMGYCFYAHIKNNKSLNYATIVCFPIILSVFQNIYLAIIAKNLSSLEMQMLLVINFVYVCMWVLFLTVREFKRDKNIRIYGIAFGVFLLYILISVIINRPNMIAALASIRNIISCMAFYIFGYALYNCTNKNQTIKICIALGLVVILIGLYEVLIDNALWTRLDIKELWIKKGMRVNYDGLPDNFYSSEMLNGKQLRRMTSTFADPVNLGTFFAAVFLVSWYKKKAWMMVLSAVSIVLTISKGGLLSVMIFLFVLILYKIKSRKIKWALIISLLAGGLAFLLYSYFFSTKSVFLHISGFINAVPIAWKKPLGYGVGNIGVLSQVLSTSQNPYITESGFGAIIGQLGVVGLMAYAVFFVYLFIRIIKIQNKEKTIFLLSLLLSIAANMVFNEVALSPNSCGLYFVLIGLFLASDNSNIAGNRKVQ